LSLRAFFVWQSHMNAIATPNFYIFTTVQCIVAVRSIARFYYELKQ
jgi:hypothetical protein